MSTVDLPISAGEPARVAPRRKPRWLLGLVYVIEVACAWLGGRRLYRAMHLSPGRFRMRREEVIVVGLPRGLEGLCIAQLSDLHGGRFLGPGDLGNVIAALDEVQPDLVVLTGDYVSHHWSDVERVAPDLGRLRSRLGTFAVFGNHDYRDRAEGRIAQRLAAEGVTFLRNESVRLDTGAGVLALVGVEDLEEGRRIDAEAARAELESGDVEVLLCHNPLGAERLERPGCVLVLSGHSHGHQIDLPFLRRAGPPHPGDRRELEHGAAITSRGLGVVGLPLRVRSPAEVVLVTLRGRSKEDSR